MKREEFSFQAMDGIRIHGYRVSPEASVEIKGIVQIAHGMAETAERYERFANTLAEHGYKVYIHNHRGHGKTAGSVEELGHLAERDGFRWLVYDMHQLSVIIRKHHPSLPLFLFGHSMGSFAAQKYSMQYGKELKGLILSGSNGNQGFVLNAGIAIASLEAKKKGRRAKSERMNSLMFGNFNKLFSPNRTEFDWLSRDEAEVDKYVADPFCGAVFTCGFYYDFLKGLKDIEKRKNRKKMPSELPLLLVAGDRDPVGKCGKGVTNLSKIYKRAGVKDITLKLYIEARHELLNESNREEVTEEILTWLDKHA